MKIKIIALALTLVIACGLLSACSLGGSDNGKVVTTTQPASDNTTTTAAPVYNLPGNTTTAAAGGTTGAPIAGTTGSVAGGQTTAAATMPFSISSGTTSAATAPVGGGSISSGSSQSGKYIVNTQTDPLSLRLTPEQNATVINTIAKGSTIEVLAVSGEWGYVVVGSTGGWVAMKYLKAA